MSEPLTTAVATSTESRHPAGSDTPGNVLAGWHPRKLIMSPPRLLDQAREAARLQHLSLRTEQAYVGWIRRFIQFHELRHPSDLGASEVEAFLSHLAVQRGVSPSTQNQALSALARLRPENLVVLLKEGQRAVRAADRAGATRAFLRVREILGQAPPPAQTSLEQVLKALEANELEAARGPAVRLENVLKVTQLYQQSLRELSPGIQGLPVERFADEPPPSTFGDPVPVKLRATRLTETPTAGRALAVGDFDNDGKEDVARLTHSEQPKLELWRSTPSGPSVLAVLAVLAVLGGCGGEPPGAAAPKDLKAPKDSKDSKDAPRVGRVVVDWQRWQDPPTRIVIGIGGVAMGPAGGAVVPYLFPGPERAEDAHFFSRTYAPFRARLSRGELVFHGRGRVRPGAVEQRMIVEWARRVAASTAGSTLSRRSRPAGNRGMRGTRHPRGWSSRDAARGPRTRTTARPWRASPRRSSASCP